jgi:transcription elongation factor GreA
VPTNASTDPTWLTQTAYDRLSAELQALIDNRRALAREIDDRRQEGDLKENGGYHAAREEQGKAEARISELQTLLRDAHVGQAPVTEGVAGTGTIVEIRWDGEDQAETFLLGSRLSKTAELEALSVDTPLGKALNGRTEGELIEYQAPNGKTLKLTLISAKPYED